MLPNMLLNIKTLFFLVWHPFWIFREMQIMMKQENENESGEEAQKETMGLIDIWLPQSKN